MKALFKSEIKNDYIYQGLREKTAEDGYKRLYSREYYLFGIKIRTHILDENVVISDIHNSDLGFRK